MDWESHVILEDDESHFFGPDIPIRRIEEQGRTFYEKAKELSKHKDYQESNNFIDKALDIYYGIFTEEYPELFNIFIAKGKNYLGLKDFDKSLECYHKAVSIINGWRKDNRLEVLTAFQEMAKASVAKNDYEHAHQYYDKCLELIATDADRYHDIYIDILDDLAHMFQVKGDPKLSLDYHYKALACIDNYYVGDQPRKARILTHIAELWRDLGEPAESLRCATVAKELFEKSPASHDPPELSWCYNTIGWALLDQGKYDEALNHFKKSVDIEIKMFGREHAELKPAFQGMKNVFEKTGKSEEDLKFEDEIEKSEEKAKEMKNM